MGKIPTQTFKTNLIKVIVAVFCKIRPRLGKLELIFKPLKFFSCTCCRKTHVRCEFSQNIFNGLNARAGYGY